MKNKMTLTQTHIHPYVFPGLNIISKNKIGYNAIKISNAKLLEWITENYLNTLLRSRKRHIIKERVALIFTINKYIHIFNNAKCNISNNVFKLNHSTFIKMVSNFNDMKSMYNKHGFFEEEMLLQKKIELKIIEL